MREYIDKTVRSYKERAHKKV